jgi:hypothetical protein
MLIKDGELISRELRRRMDKVAVRRMVSAMLDGADLRFRPLKNELVITNPRAPENGRIRIEYATGHVSWQREVWGYFGPLQGFETEDNDDETYVSADVILKILRDGTPPEPGVGPAGMGTTSAE